MTVGIRADAGGTYGALQLNGADALQFGGQADGQLAGSRNRIINGNMVIAQRGTSFAAIADAAYSLDRWKYGKVGATVHTITQDTDVPTVAQAGRLFTNSLRLNLTTPDTSIAAGDYALFQQNIEGYNFIALAQRTMVLTFWVKATLAGTYCVSFANSGVDRSYVAEYTVNSTATWEKKTVVIPASPSAGTWGYTNGSGLQVRFALAAGSTFQTTAGSWQTGNFLATANQVNGVNTGATDFRITAVQLEAGSIATPFESRHYGTERMLCQRYYEIGSYSLLWGSYTSGTFLRDTMLYKVTKRATAAVILNSTFTNQANAATVVVQGGEEFTYQAQSTAIGVAIESSGTWTASAEL